MERTRRLFACVGLLMLVFVSANPAKAGSAERTVKAGGGGDFTAIQPAIDDALTVSGTTIIVYPGTYVENIRFNGKDIVVRSTDPENPQVVATTIIDGNQAGSVVTFDQNEPPTAAIRGFTIRNGRVTSPGITGSGAGVACRGTAQPTIARCVIEDNVSLSSGGGVSFGVPGGIMEGGSSASPLLTNCVIRNNDAALGGGGVYSQDASSSFHVAPRIFNCEISENVVDGANNGGSGGGILGATSGSQRLVLTGCLIENNQSDGGAGATLTNARVESCTIRNNHASFAGGGAQLERATVVASSISGNTAPIGAGATLWGGTIETSVIENNVATIYAGGLSLGGHEQLGAATVRDSIIRHNIVQFSGTTGWGLGGGIFGDSYSENRIERTVIEYNQADEGAGIDWFWGTITNCTIRNNVAENNGGGLADCNGPVLNNSIQDNQAWEGAGLYNCDGSVRGNLITDNVAGIAGGGLRACNGEILSNTIVNNWAGFAGGGIAGCAGVINGNLIWGNTALVVSPQIYFSSDPSYCNVQGGAFGGIGNINEDPKIASSYRLLPGSPCINMGDPTYAPLAGELDIDSQSRIANGRVDIGADEFSPLCIPGDFSGDGFITTVDISAFVAVLTSNMSPNSGDLCRGDLNMDGIVNGRDISGFVGVIHP